MIIIRTNLLSLNAQKQQGISQTALETSIQRLSSGLRINSARDDAAGMAIANRMTSMIQGQGAAARNANDGISLGATAEGALSSINERLQRIRVLSVQGLNGSLNQVDRDTIQAEINLNFKEIDRISTQTQFNGKHLLDGSVGALNLQVGAYDNHTLKIDMGKQGFSTEALGLKDYYISGIFGDITDIDTLSGTAVNVVLGDSNTTVNYRDQNGNAMSADTKLMRFPTSVGPWGNYYVQSTDENGNTAHYAASYASHSETATRSSTVDVSADTLRYFKETSEVQGNTLGSGTVQFLDQNGIALAPGSSPVLVQDDTQGHYYIRTQEAGETFYYRANITSTSYGPANSPSNTADIQIETSSPRFSTQGYTAAPDSLPTLSLSSASINWQNQDGLPFSGGANPDLVEAFGSYYVRAGVSGSYLYYEADIQTDLASNTITIKADIGTTQSFNDTDVIVLPDTPAASLTTISGLPAGSTLILGNDDNRYYLKTNSSGDDIFTPIDLTINTASDGSSSILASSNGTIRQAAAFSAANSLPSGALPDLTLSGSSAPIILDMPGTDLVVNDQGQYWLRELRPDGVTFHLTQVKTEINSNGDYQLSVDTRNIVTNIDDAQPLQGTSTISLNTPLPSNVEITYVDRNGKTYQNVLGKDDQGNYVLNLPNYGNGLSATATLVQVDNLSDNLISQNGDVLIKTTNGTGEVVIYYAMTYTATTDAGNDHTTMVITETGGEIRLRQPRDPLAAMDRAIAIIDGKRGELGAIQNRLDSVINNLTNSNIQLSAARSRIEDTDYALEVSNMTRAQILQQASSSMLAQANQVPNTVLELLR